MIYLSLIPFYVLMAGFTHAWLVKKNLNAYSDTDILGACGWPITLLFIAGEAIFKHLSTKKDKNKPTTF